MTQHTPEEILKAIQERHVTMTPRWLIVIRVALIAVLLVVVAIAMSFLTSFLWFAWHRSHLDVLPGFGASGFTALATLFPWAHFVTLLVIIAALIALLRHFTVVGYRVPLLALVGGTVAVLIGVGYAVIQTPLHTRLQERADRDGLPLLGRLYRGVPQRARGVIHHGIINEVRTNGFVLATSTEDEDDALITVKTNDKTQVLPGWVPLVGEDVVVLSKNDGKTVTALGVRPVPPRFYRTR